MLNKDIQTKVSECYHLVVLNDSFCSSLENSSYCWTSMDCLFYSCSLHAKKDLEILLSHQPEN